MSYLSFVHLFKSGSNVGVKNSCMIFNAILRVCGKNDNVDRQRCRSEAFSHFCLNA